MNVMYPGIDRMKGWRNAMIDYLASYLPQSQIPNPPTFGMNAVFAPSSYQDVGRGVMNALIPEPEDTIQSLMMPVAFHRTTPLNALKIKQEGFNLKNFGQGAGYGLMEEPSGIFLSPHSGDDFLNEVTKRGLPFTEKLKVRYPEGKIWEPTRQERFDKFNSVQNEFIKNNYNLTDEQALAISRGKAKYIKDNELTDIFRDYVSPKTELMIKDYFRNKLIDEGYIGMRWTEPIHNVDQLLMFKPNKLKVIK